MSSPPLIVVDGSKEAFEAVVDRMRASGVETVATWFNGMLLP